MMNLDTAKTAVGNLLSEVGITAVYYVDDKFQEDKRIDERFEEFQIEIRKHHADQRKDDIADERVRFAGLENLDDEIRRWWSESSPVERQHLVEKYLIGGIENTRPATLIRDVLEDTCTCCSPLEWNDSHKSTVLGKIGNDETILLLFDHELSNGHNGFQYATETLATAGANNCAYCGIISQGFTTDGEFDKRKEYRKEQPGYYIYPLSKERLIVQDDDYEPFVAGLKNILWVKHIESIKNHTKEVLSDAFKTTIDRYLEIQPPAYKKIIIESSQREGCREIDTILRLMQIIWDKEVKEAITSETLSDINNEINRVSKIHDTEIVHHHPEVDSQAKGFIHDEKFIAGNIINKLHTPLQNGDIFKKGENLFILLCQPCNITIREKGNRSNQYDVGFWVPLTLSDKVSTNNSLLKTICSDVKNMLPTAGKQANSQKLNEHRKSLQRLLASENPMNCPLDFEIDGNEYTAQLNNFKIVSLSLLDNVSFNADGKAIIDFNSTSTPAGLHRNLVARQRYIKEQFKDWSKIKGNAGELCYECQWLIDLKELLLKFSRDLKLENIESDKITLPIQRVGHYRRPYSDDLLTKFSHYISRAGFPHPLI